MAAFNQLFDQPVSSLMQKRPLLVIDADDKPLAAFSKLVDFGVLSAPVLEKGSTTKYAGFLALRDLVDVTVIASQLKEEERKGLGDTPAPASFLGVTLAPNILQQAKWVDIPYNSDTEFDRAFSVQYLARRNPFLAVSPTDGVRKVIELLTRADVHRVPVVGDSGELLDIISQSRVIAFLQQNVQHAAKEFDVSVAEADVGSRPVLTVQSSDPTIKAYQLMKEHEVSAVAIVERNGRLQGCVSGSDLKLYLRKPSFGYLNKPAGDFIKEIRQTQIETTKYPAVTVATTDTVAKCIAKLAATRLHRVFVTESYESFEPIGVISLTDVCKHIVKVL